MGDTQLQATRKLWIIQLESLVPTAEVQLAFDTSQTYQPSVDCRTSTGANSTIARYMELGGKIIFISGNARQNGAASEQLKQNFVRFFEALRFQPDLAFCFAEAVAASPSVPQIITELENLGLLTPDAMIVTESMEYVRAANKHGCAVGMLTSRDAMAQWPAEDLALFNGNPRLSCATSHEWFWNFISYKFPRKEKSSTQTAPVGTGTTAQGGVEPTMP